MSDAVYRAGAAMLKELVRQDVHAHNLANSTTVGFRATLAQTAGAVQANGALTSSVDTRQGDIRPTGNPLDVALKGNGYFVLEAGAGRQYTRKGSFTIRADGYLASAEGLRVLGTAGPIAVPQGRIEIGQDGSVLSNGRLLDHLLVVDFPPGTRLASAPGSAVLGAVAPAQVAKAQVESGAVEGSNVSPVTEMVAMTAGYRVYEANANAVSQLDHASDQLIQAATG